VTTNERRVLGASGIDVSALGLSTDSWGAKLLGYSKIFGGEDLNSAYRASLDAGIDFFDTAPEYGKGQSEELLGQFRRQDGRAIVIATKYDNSPFPIPFLKSPSPRALAASLDESLKRLGVERIDLYQIHYPLPGRRIDEFADALATAVRSGKVRAVGVCNFNASLMRAMHAGLAERGIPLASNQVAFDLLDRSTEINGVLDACRELNVALIPSIPLAVGVLMGELGPFQERGLESESLLKRALSTPAALGNLGLLFASMQAVAGTREKSLVQVALNWLLTADPLVIPLPSARSVRQAQENAGALEWQMTPGERLSISQAGGAAI
jgi:aryl-alcohol dehydrogenase-like predicted oxidoreductase